MRHVLNINVYVEENDKGVRKFAGIDITVPDEFERVEVIGYMQMAQVALANNDDKVKEYVD